MDSPFGITVYDSTFARVGSAGGLVSATFNPKKNAVGVATISLAPEDPVNAYLQAPGARVTCTYSGGLLMSGPVRAIGGGFRDGDPIAYTVEDDYRLVMGTLAWVVPAAAYNSTGALQPTSLSDDGQTVSTVAHTAGTDSGYGAYVFESGTRTAETAIKELIRKNAQTRLGRPVTIAPDQQRGGDAFAAGKLPVLRFDTIGEGIQQLLDWSGLRLMVWQDEGGSTLNVDVYQGSQWPQLLTVENGIVVPDNASWTIDYPTATRSVNGGPGDGTGRAYTSTVDAGLESTYADVIEVFRDATSAPMVWDASVGSLYQVAKYYTLQTNQATDIANYRAAMAAAGAGALADGVAKSGLSLELSETPTFHFGGSGGIQLGDLVSVSQRNSGTPVFSDSLTEAQLDFTPDAGLVVRPIVGQINDDPDVVVARALLALAAGARRRAAHR